MTEEEQKLFRLYGKLPSKKDILKNKLKERKYFDSGDYALSKAGKASDVGVTNIGSQHPHPENIPHIHNSPKSGSEQLGSSISSPSSSGVSGIAGSPVLAKEQLPGLSHVHSKSPIASGASIVADDVEDEEESAPEKVEGEGKASESAKVDPVPIPGHVAAPSYLELSNQTYGSMPAPLNLSIFLLRHDPPPPTSMKRRRNPSTAVESSTGSASDSETARSSRRTAIAPHANVEDNHGSALATSELTTLRVPSTPGRRKAGTGILNGAHLEPAPSPSPRKKNLLMTPQKVRFLNDGDASPSVVTNADKSARRKSVRRMVAKTLNDEDGTDDDDDEEYDLVGKIYSDSEEESGSEDEELEESASRSTMTTGKSKAPPPPLKAKGRKKRETTPPPSFMDGVESYFHQNKKARQQTSTATLSSLPQLDHSTYFSLLRSHPDHHADVRKKLFDSHLENMPQWIFELSEGFNLLFYGYGSKRALLTEIANTLYTTPGSIVIINGYLPTITLKDVLNIIFSAIFAAASSSITAKLGATPNDMVENVLSLLSEPDAQPLTMIIHNLDGESLRAERAQAIIARIAAHPKISLVASIDHIRAPLLWDAARKEQFNFLWHDVTTFEPYSVEIPADEVLVLGDGAGRAGGTKGVKYVLASLPTNAKALFRVLVSEQLQAMVEDEGGKERKNIEDYGIEYRVLYQKAVDLWTTKWSIQRKTDKEQRYYGRHLGRRI
ncbi:ORC2-domain-containing protein [Ascodesmis nigricans]|uniref:ORC2-domain-containing protein n=1 Tax=Ascodesmis nigricans TaxID=341454 RepID=A0A4S2N1D5_9PEZI|nr:ORC2-domain-containing protein [Ascodesmis nigricans]